MIDYDYAQLMEYKYITPKDELQIIYSRPNQLLRSSFQKEKGTARFKWRPQALNQPLL